MSGKAIDYSYADPPPAPAAIRRAEVRGVIRYISPNPKKNLDISERDALLKERLWVLLVWEHSAARAGQGKAAGIEDVREAERQADLLGYPRTDCIMYAVDYDATPSQVIPYFAGLESANTRPIGCYGSYKIIEAALAPWLWQTEAWSSDGRGGRRISAKAHLVQRVSHSFAIQGSRTTDWDENDIMHGVIPVLRPGDTLYKPPPKQILTSRGERPDAALAKTAEALALMEAAGDLGNTQRRADINAAIASLSASVTAIKKIKPVRP